MATPENSISIDECIKKRGHYKGRVTGVNNRLKEAKPEAVTVRFVDQLLSSLDSVCTQFDVYQIELELVDQKYAEDRMDFERNYSATLTLAQELKRNIKYEKGLVPQSIASGSQTADQPAIISAKPAISLPNINLPKFSGLQEEWNPFYELFVSLIHSNDAIPDVQKHHYLRSCLTGQAAQIVEALSITADNYKLALHYLKDKYDQPHLVVKRNVAALFNLEPIRNENAGALRNLYDKTLRHLRALEACGQPVQQWDAMLIHLITQRLDVSTLRGWESETASTQEDATFNKLLEYLLKRCRILEALPKSTERRKDKPPNRPFSRSKSFNTSVEKPRYKGSNGMQKTTYSCVLCNESHPVYYCEAFKAMTVDERRKHAQNQNLCFNCLSNKHSFSNCPSQRRCFECKQKHHTLLHRPAQYNERKQNESIDTAIEDNQVRNRETASTHNQNSSTRRGSHVLLSTAMVNVRDKHNQWQPLRCLLDSAATHDFITESAVEQLGLTTAKTEVTVTGIDQKTTEALSFAKLDIEDRNERTYRLNLNCLVISHIGSDVPSSTFSTQTWKFPRDIMLADPHFNQQNSVGILLSA